MCLNAILTLFIPIGSSSHLFVEGFFNTKLFLKCNLKCTKFNLPVDFTREKGRCCCQQNHDKNKYYTTIKGKMLIAFYCNKFDISLILCTVSIQCYNLT